MARTALDTVLLGRLGEIHAGEEIPDTYPGADGEDHPTDFARLEESGYVAPLKRGKTDAAPADAA
jgi:hypothetical protein